MKLVKTDDAQFARDMTTSAVLNIDTAAYRHFQQEREQALRVQQVTREVGELRNELGEIKQLLAKLVNGRTND